MDNKQKSREYWEKRARENENKVYKKAGDLKKDLDEHYVKARREIQKSINDLVARYMDKTELSYATPSWYPSYWGGSEFGRTYVKGDGTYEVSASLADKCSGAVVWAIELYDLWKDLVDPTQVKVKINHVLTPSK